MSESVVLCEGYHDRAFWSGCLEYCGCENLGRRPAGTGVIRVRDPWGTPVRAGQFAFRSRREGFIRLVPCHGKDNILRAARSRLSDRETKSLSRLVLCADSDAAPADAAADAGGPTLRPEAVEGVLREFGECPGNEQGDRLLDDGATAISLVRWQTGDAGRPGFPAKQTLERLVCAALVAAYPARGSAVQTWLGSRPNAPAAAAKEYAWSHMAGWYAEFACEGFYRKIWLDPRVAGELRSRLVECGAWRVAEALAEEADSTRS